MSELNTAIGLSSKSALAARIGAELYAFPLDAVDEVLPALPITRLAQCPTFLRGIVFVREELLPVLNTARRLGIRDYQRPDEPHIVCLRNGDRLIGLEVDEALDLVRLDLGKHLTAAEVWAPQGCLAAVVELHGQIYRLLDPDRLLSNRELAALDELSQTTPELA